MPANRVYFTISNTPGTSGNFACSAAVSGYRSLGAADNGKSFDVFATDGTAWEVRTDCVYTHSTATLTRGTLEESSTGSAIDLTGSAKVGVTLTEGRAQALRVASETRLGVGAPPLFRAALFGDSMTAQFEADNAPTMTYNRATGLISCASANHLLETGWEIAFHANAYASTQRVRVCPVTVVDASNYTFQIEPGLMDLPDGTPLTGSAFARYVCRRAIYSWVNWALSLLGWPVDIVRNAAASGQTTAHRLLNIENDLLQWKPQVVFMQLPGINDMRDTNGSRNEEEIFADQCAILDRILASGALVVCGGATPVASGHSQAATGDMARVASLNRRMRERMRGNRNTIWVDNYGVVVDPASASGLARAGYLRADNIHYSGFGAYKVGKMVADVIKSRISGEWCTLPKSQMDYYRGSAVTASSVNITNGIATFNATAHGIRAGERVGVFGSSTAGINGWATIISADANSFTFACSAADGTASGTITASRSRNIAPNPLFVNATGGTVTAPVTGTAAAGVRVMLSGGSGTVEASVPDDPEGFGKQQLATISALDAGASTILESAVRTDLMSYVTPGEKVFLEARLHVGSDDWTKTQLSDLRFRLIFHTPRGLPNLAAIYEAFEPDGSLTGDLILHLRTAAQAVPADATRMYWQFIAKAKTAFASTMRIGVSRVAVVTADA